MMDIRRSVLIRSIFACILAVLALPAFAAQPGDLSMSIVSTVPENGVISAHEPLTARVRLTNNTNREVTFAVWDMRVVVYDDEGNFVGETPINPLPMDLMVGLRQIPAYGSISRWVVISALYQFKEPGNFTVHLQQLTPDKEQSVRAECTTEVRVLPFNEKQLKARCDEIFAPLRSLPADLSDFPMKARLNALYSIRHDTVLPYLSIIAREWTGTSESWLALESIRRVGSKQSEKLLRSLATRSDKVGKSARGMVANIDRGVKTPYDEVVDDWYVGDYWKPDYTSYLWRESDPNEFLSTLTPLSR